MAGTQFNKAELDILVASHKFLREDSDQAKGWNDKLAEKYYSSLYREFALCDLKHYKTGNFALRWRSESEVLDSKGEKTCGNIRCDHHSDQPETIPLSILELPFAYVEDAVQKSALVKVVLCKRCVGKLMWKRRKEKELEVKQEEEQTEVKVEEVEPSLSRKKHDRPKDLSQQRHPRRSRSRSPARRSHYRRPS